jgi:hypothetical protein
MKFFMQTFYQPLFSNSPLATLLQQSFSFQQSFSLPKLPTSKASLHPKAKSPKAQKPKSPKAKSSKAKSKSKKQNTNTSGRLQ